MWAPFSYIPTALDHFASPAYHEAAKRAWGELLRTELPWFSAAYILLVPLLRYARIDSLYLPHKAAWKEVMWWYNIVMSVFSLGCFVLSTFAISRHKLFSEDCEAIFRDSLFVWVAYLFYWSKFVEYADTFFLLLRGESVSWLQWFHHIGAAWSMWGLVHFHNEQVWMFVTLNSFIHTIMYYYYATSVRGQRLKWMPKQMLTSMQIVQFITGFVLLHGYLEVACFRDDPLRMLAAFYFSWFYVGGVLLLFLNFFIQSYIIQAPKPKKKISPASLLTPENKKSQ